MYNNKSMELVESKNNIESINCMIEGMLHCVFSIVASKQVLLLNNTAENTSSNKV